MSGPRSSNAKKSGRIRYQEILDACVRSPDPFVRLKGRWIVRRLAPDCSRVELASIPQERDESRLLYSMGFEIANVHLGSAKAAKASGVHNTSIIVSQLIRNVASAPLAYCFSIVGPVIVFAAGLNFLGLGIQPPDPEWGSMLYALQSSLLVAPLTSIVPGIPIAVAALLLDVIGNAVRDVLDPRVA